MKRHRIRAWCSVALLLVLTAIPVTGVRAQSTPSGAGAGAAAAPHSNGSYLGSLLKEPGSEPSCAPNIGSIYQADAIVTGTDMRQRPWGFAHALRSVLVKASGDPRLKDDPRAAQATAHPDGYVVCFSYVDMMAGVPLHDDQGTYDRPHKLTVTFDPAKIDLLLAQFGDKPWHGERPVIVPVLLVRGPRPPPYLLSAENPQGADQRGSFATWAGEFDMKSRMPGEAEFAAWGLSVDHFAAVPPVSTEREAIVAGTLDWSETLPGWIGKWHCRWRGVDHSWGISGVNYDAAFRDLIGGVMLLAAGNGSPD